MKLFNLIISFSIITLLIFSFFGLIIASNLSHELSHKNDLKDIAKDDYICLLTYPNSLRDLIWWPIARYNFKIDENANLTDYSKITKTTEVKAYLISTGMSLLWVIAYTIALRWICKIKIENISNENNKTTN